MSHPGTRLAAYSSLRIHRSVFDRFSKAVSRFAGHPPGILRRGPRHPRVDGQRARFWLSYTSRLLTDTATTTVGFLMGFLIQDARYRDGEAIQIKLDELIRAVEPAQNSLFHIEELCESDGRASPRSTSAWRERRAGRSSPA